MDVEVKAISRSGGEPLRFKLTSKEIITCLIIAKLEGAFWLLQHFFEFRMRAFFNCFTPNISIECILSAL